MKSIVALFLVATLAATAAFSPLPWQPPMTPSPSSLLASRRGFLEAATAICVFLGPSSALAEPRAVYLTEPTEEFKENEAKAAAFKREQLLVKKDFLAAIDKLTSESNDADALVADVKAIQGLVAKNAGLPLGIKKDELFKLIRSKKAKGFWPTPVEVA
jgi:hypothetical protein